jgi:hypothetical protein
MTSTVGFSRKRKNTIQYPNIPHSESLPIPEPPKTYTLEPEIDLKDFKLQPGPSYASTDDDECFFYRFVKDKPESGPVGQWE